MGCCVGNAARQLHMVWRDTVSWDPERKRLNVHLLMNRASRWADVHSHIPASGLVEVDVKADCDLAVRSPEWCDAVIDTEGEFALVERKQSPTGPQNAGGAQLQDSHVIQLCAEAMALEEGSGREISYGYVEWLPSGERVQGVARSSLPVTVYRRKSDVGEAVLTVRGRGNQPEGMGLHERLVRLG